MTIHAPPPAPPIGLLVELTHRCPLGCPYCSNPLALDRPGTEGFATRDAAFLHAESCDHCTQLLMQSESLDFALSALAEREARQQVSSRVEQRLLEEFRQQMRAVRPGLRLSIAVGHSPHMLPGTDFAAIATLVDQVGIMNYDYTGPWSPTTGFLAPLFDPLGPAGCALLFPGFGDA